MNVRKKFVFQQAMSITSWAKTKKLGDRRVKSWPNVATKQLQSCKTVQQKSRDITCKAKFFPPYLRKVAKIYVATSHNVVWLETIEISKQRTAFIWFFAQEVDWCLKDCDKQRLQTTVSINLWKIFAGHTGDWFDVRTALICTTELRDALKSFILTSLKFKVAPYHIIVSLDTLRPAGGDPEVDRQQKYFFDGFCFFEWTWPFWIPLRPPG